MYQLNNLFKQQQVTIFFRQQGLFNLIVYLSIFLLPLAAISVRHWASNFFIFLFLLSLHDIIFRRDSFQPLIKQQKYFSTILFLYFAVFLFSALLNGWHKAQTYELGTMLRFLLAIPIFIMFRKLQFIFPVIIFASIVAVIANVIYLYIYPEKGVYGHLFSGPMVFLSLLFFLPTIKYYRTHWLVSLVLLSLFAVGIYTIFQLGTRSVFVAMFMVAIVYIVYYSKGMHRVYYFIALIVLGLSAYTMNDNVKSRVDYMFNGISVYMSADHPATTDVDFNAIHAVSARFEMWRSTKYLFMKNPIWGVGPGNYEKEIKILIENKLINPVAMATHPHNAFINDLVSKGGVGLIFMLLVLYYPLFVFITTAKNSPLSAVVGISVVIAISAFSLTESASFNKNNFSSMMLFYLTALFSVSFMGVHKQKTNSVTVGDHL